MGIQPIDLQTMYSQIATVAKQASHLQQGVELSQAMQQVNVIRENQENAEKVHQTDENSKAGTINKNGKNAGGGGEKSKKREKDDAEKSEEVEVPQPKLKEAYLGQHIDITR